MKFWRMILVSQLMSRVLSYTFFLFDSGLVEIVYYNLDLVVCLWCRPKGVRLVELLSSVEPGRDLNGLGVGSSWLVV